MNFSISSRQLFAAMGLLAFCVIGHTQGVDAGSLMRQAEQSYRASNSARLQNKLVPIEPPITLPSGEFLRVKKFKFLGAKLINLNELEAASSPFVDRDLHQTDLDNLCSAVADAYRQVGWVVRVYVPRQPINSDTLTLQVLENVHALPSK
jgi:hemolysin activation/secretion protein